MTGTRRSPGLSEGDVEEWLLFYRPQVAPEIYTRFRPLLLRYLIQFRYSSPNVLRNETWLLLTYLRWLDEQGVPLDDPEIFLTPAWVHAFFDAPDTPKSTATMRWSFTRWGRHLTKRAGWPPSRAAPSSGRTPLPVYSAEEDDILWWFVQRQSSVLKRTTGVATFAACRGAGLSLSEVRNARARWVRQVDDVVAIEVQGPRARLVPVLRRYGPDLLNLASSLHPDAQLTGRPADSYFNGLLATLDPVPLDRVPMLSTLKLRHTWLLELLGRNAPLQDVVQAAGGLGVETIRRLMTHLESSSEADYLSVIAGTDNRPAQLREPETRRAHGSTSPAPRLVLHTPPSQARKA